MARPPLHKSGPMTATELQRRWRKKVKKQKEAEAKLAPLRAKRERRAALERALAAYQVAIPVAKFGIIYTDPPWRFEPWSRETGMDRAADNHYPTMTLEQLRALELPAADDCVLFMWSTVSQLNNAICLIEAWGFTYKSAHGWAKPRIGTGYWVRDNLELLLIATRGHPVAPAPGQQLPALIEAPQADHSTKPAVFAEMIERLYPNIPKLEMFARQARPGWDTWGNESNRERLAHREIQYKSPLGAADTSSIV